MAAEGILGRQDLYPHQKEAVRYLIQHNESDTSDQDCDSKFLFVGTMTGSSKSSIAYLATAMMTKVTIFVVPTIALGVDQHEKLLEKLVANGCVADGMFTCFRLSCASLNNTKSKKPFHELSKLATMDPHARPAVILFCNPDVIFEVQQKEGTWGHYLANDFRSFVGLVVLDEAHLVREQGFTFCKAYADLNLFVKAMPCPKLVMTALFTEDYEIPGEDWQEIHQTDLEWFSSVLPCTICENQAVCEAK